MSTYENDPPDPKDETGEVSDEGSDTSLGDIEDDGLPSRIHGAAEE